jgi:heme/copper-type cytochrome/quinol oxidase subunit 3
MASPVLALPAAGASGTGAEARRNSVPLGVAVAGAAIAALVGGLVAAYLALKAQPGSFLPKAASFDNYTAGILVLTGLMAMVTIEWANYGIRKNFRGQALFGFGITALLEVAFLNALYYLITKLPFSVDDGPYQAVVHALLGVPFLLAVAALLGTILTGLRAVGHQLTTDNLHIGRATAILLHLTVAAWVAAYYAVYVTK